MMTETRTDRVESLMQRLAGDTRLTEAFARVSCAGRGADARVVCVHADHADVEYRVESDAGRLWVVMATPDRWLSQSIEADLMYTGDKLDDLLDEEANDAGYRGKALPFEHFRSDDMEYVFRTPMPDAPHDEDAPAQFLLAYACVFGQLGDLKPGEDDDA